MLVQQTWVPLSGFGLTLKLDVATLGGMNRAPSFGISRFRRLGLRPPTMKRAIILIALLLALFAAKPASAANTQLLVKANFGAPAMNLVCLLRGCQVTQTVNGSPSNFFVISVPSSANTSFLMNVLKAFQES